MLRQQDVGHRIVVRRIVGIREGRPLFSDALGELVELSETHLTLATAQGRLRVPVARGAPGQAGAADPPADRRRGGRPGTGRRRGLAGAGTRAGSATGCCARPTAGPAGPTRRCRSATRTARCRQPWTRSSAGTPNTANQRMINTPLPLAAPVGAELDARGWTSPPADPGTDRRHCRPADRASTASADTAAGRAGRPRRASGVAGRRRRPQGRPAGRRTARAHRRGPGPLRPPVRRRHADRRSAAARSPARAAGWGSA